MKALIALEDGTVFEGRSFTGPGEAVGEIVFNTSMSGYQEILTDPSYTGQIVTMTYPLIGNYGVNPEDMESAGVHPKAFLVKEYSAIPSNFRSRQTLADFLRNHNLTNLEKLKFDGQKLLRILPEIVDQLDEFRGQLIEIVVQLLVLCKSPKCPLSFFNALENGSQLPCGLLE